MKKIIFKTLGVLFVAIGFVGIFLPLLPTTIFLIIASYFFMKSSPELNEWMLNNKYLGVYIRSFKDNKGMSRKSKISAISLLWTTILISAIFFTEDLIIRIIFILIASGVSLYIANIKNFQTQTIRD